MKRICYGIVLPGLIIGAVLYIHIPAKYGKFKSAFLDLHVEQYNELMDSFRESSSKHSSFDPKYMAALDRLDVSTRPRDSRSSLMYSGCIVVTGVLVFIFSLAIPVFDDLLTLISAICGCPLAVQVSPETSMTIADR